VLNGEGEPMWLTPHQRDSQPEEEREREGEGERERETAVHCSWFVLYSPCNADELAA